MVELRKRSLVKTMSWRAIATATTVAIVFLFTGELALSFGIGALEVVIKMMVYYLHERVWQATSWGIVPQETANDWEKNKV